MPKVCVGPYQALQTTRRASARIEQREIIICLVGQRVVAYDGVCLHQGGPLSQGRLVGTTLSCAWHGCPWDLETGCLVPRPQVRLKSHRTSVEDGNVYVLVDEDL